MSVENEVTRRCEMKKMLSTLDILPLTWKLKSISKFKGIAMCSIFVIWVDISWWCRNEWIIKISFGRQWDLLDGNMHVLSAENKILNLPPKEYLAVMLATTMLLRYVKAQDVSRPMWLYLVAEKIDRQKMMKKVETILRNDPLSTILHRSFDNSSNECRNYFTAKFTWIINSAQSST